MSQFRYMFYSRDFSSLPIFHVDISKEISDVLNLLFGKYENCIVLENYHGRRKLALTLTLPGPSAGVSGSLDSYCSLKPLCSGMGEVPARTSPTLLPHPLTLCCHYPVSKYCSASIVVTSTVRLNFYDHQVIM